MAEDKKLDALRQQAKADEEKAKKLEQEKQERAKREETEKAELRQQHEVAAKRKEAGAKIGALRNNVGEASSKDSAKEKNEESEEVDSGRVTRKAGE